jgi:hypothetical protein
MQHFKCVPNGLVSAGAAFNQYQLDGSANIAYRYVLDDFVPPPIGHHGHGTKAIGIAEFPESVPENRLAIE